MTRTLPGTLTLAEALRALGLPEDDSAPHLDASTLRNAYGRALERCSPESNPLEFQRIRDAYTLLEERRQAASHAALVGEDDPDWFKLLPYAFGTAISIAVSVIVWSTRTTTSSRDVARPPVQAYERWTHESCRDFPPVCGPARVFASVLQEQVCSRVAAGLETFRAVAARELPAETATLVAHRAHQIARSQCPGAVAPVRAPNEASP